MRIVKPGYEIIPNDMDVLKKIEYVARVCYKSEDKIKEGSAEKLVSFLINRKHEAMLEHASFCFKIDDDTYSWMSHTIRLLEDVTDFKSYLSFSTQHKILVSGNVRAWRDFLIQTYNAFEKLPLFTKDFILSNPVLFPELQDATIFDSLFGSMTLVTEKDLTGRMEKLKHKRLSVKFTVDRGISHEIVRHRPASFGQESTRYCNYVKDDFGGEIAVIEPFYLEEGTHGYTVWKGACQSAETAYFNLLNWGCTPQEARGVLPTHLKTEIVMTATLSEWVHFFNLRAIGTTGAPHPQIREVAMPLLIEQASIEPEIFGELEVPEK